MNAGEQVRIKGEGRLGTIHSAIDPHGRTLYVVLYDDHLRGSPMDPGDDLGPFGIVCSADYLEPVE
jgi:hypothetical protein